MHGTCTCTCSYRKLGLKNHPDSNKSPGADEKFKEIAEAYDVLSECTFCISLPVPILCDEILLFLVSSRPRIASRRALYDKFGEDGLKGGVPTSDGGAIFNVYSLLHAAQLYCMTVSLQSIPLGTLSMEMQIECSRTFSEETTHFQVALTCRMQCTSLLQGKFFA